MRDYVLRTAICLLVLCGLAADQADAAQRTRQRKIRGDRPGQAESYSLDDIMKSPREYLDREVMFYARYATTANLFKQINTRFNSNSHVNLAVWPDKAALWTEEGRKNVLPTLYILKNEPDVMAELHQVRRYELIAVTGTVQNVYAGCPWILVKKIERIEKPSDRLVPQVIEHMQAGLESLDAGSGGAAASHFEQALQFGLPHEYRATAYKQLAQAYLIENKLDRARGYLREAVEMNRNDPVLHLALADVCLQMDDPGEALAHASIALEISGKYPQAYGIRGEAQSLLGDYAKAFGDLSTAAGTPGITPREKAVIALRRARIYARSDRPTDAARIYATVSEPGETLSTDANVHNEIGLFYERLFLESGDAAYLDSAGAAFGEAANLATLNPAFLYNQAEVEFRRQKLAETPDMTKVLEIIEKISHIDPDYAPARLLLGRVYFVQEKTAEAEEIYQSVAPQLGENAVALLALAEAYVELGRYEDAVTAVRTAREIQPWNRRLQALGQQIEDNAAEKIQFAVAEMRAREAELEAAAAEAASAAAEAEAAGNAEFEDAGLESPDLEAGSEFGLLPPPESAEGADARDKYYEGSGYENSDGAPEAESPESVADSRAFRPYIADPAPDMPMLDVSFDSDAAPSAHPLRPSAAASSASSLPSFGEEDDLVSFDRPAMGPPLGADRARLPVTKVELPEKITPPAPLPPLDLGYTPGNNDMLGETGAPALITDQFAEDWNGHERGAAVDSEGYLQFGMSAVGAVENITAAYASLPVPAPEGDAPRNNDGGGVRIPPVFTFDPDTSPVIIADVRSRAVPGRRHIVRNANLYKRQNHVRRPAEIIERDGVAPQDTSAMAAPASPAQPLPRTAVRLPTSSPGIGLAEE